MVRVAVAVLALLAVSSCAFDELDTEAVSAEVEVDPVAACAIPALDAIAGHEAVFYRCAEDAADHGMGCGSAGYLIGYGARYAERFYRTTRPRMSSRGRRWIDEVLVCLQRDLRDAIDETSSCEEIHEVAFDSHPACYVEAGFCTLSLFDLLQVVWTIDLRDWLSQDAARQLVHTAAACGDAHLAMVRLFFGGLLEDY
jgi:hypothetical protein